MTSEWDMLRGDYNDRQAMADWDQKYLYGDTNVPTSAEVYREKYGPIIESAERRHAELMRAAHEALDHILKRVKEDDDRTEGTHA